VKPTAALDLLVLALVGAAVGWLLPSRAYGSVASLPGYAPALALVLAALVLAIARIVSNQRRGRSRGKAMDPLQIARAAALGKAASAAGGLLFGFYGGFFAWTFPRRDTLAAASGDARMAAVSAVSSVALLVAALVLERSCRAGAPPSDWGTE
jgi:hypothetical protein